ncbi:MAG: 2,3-bisphosphoglycerate-independent phosphoglycerate mutase [bacterium]|nr:2,3-bisphosphoglycerate-independent phosphoglycerate mutase [bacterium]
MRTFKQVILIILDGFGVASASEGNAVTLAVPRNLNYLINNYLATTLQASGPSVGLPWGERGNSEVGHLNIGSGRIVSQDLGRISNAIQSGDFFKNQSFLAAIDHVKKNSSSLHFVGLVSDGGVHSSAEHLYALLHLAAEHKITKVFVHMFSDGRDTHPKAALGGLDKLTRKFLETHVGQIASITGRFYAMDRGEHWEVTQKTFEALTQGMAAKTDSARKAIEGYYQEQLSDETIPPTVMVAASGEPTGLIRDNDAVIFFNFRPDRMRQLVKAFVDPAFDKFSKKYPFLQNMFYVAMTLYEKDLPMTVAFPPIEEKNCLSEVVSSSGRSQMHIAESEKYAHVTYFFNGGREAPFPAEQREIISSPEAYQKRYEDVPEMSVEQLTSHVIEKLKSGTNFILANFANTDMVGHTGNREACIRAVTAVDLAVGKIFEAANASDTALIVTADHGKIEQIFDLRTGQIDTEHSLNPVPFVLAGKGLAGKKIRQKGYMELAAVVPDGVLSDVAPTVLELLGIDKPAEMSAISLLPLLSKQL